MPRISRLLARSVITGAALYILIVVVLHFLRPDYHPARRFLSEYAVGRFGGLGTAAFCVLAGTTAALAALLFLKARHSSFLLAVCILLGLVSVGFCVLALFPTDLCDPKGGPPPIRTVTGNIHDTTTGIMSAALCVAAALLPFAYGRDTRWRPAFSTAAVFAVLIPLAFCIANLVSWQWRGAGQRVAVATGLTWIFANARLLLRARQSRGREVVAGTR